MILLSEFKLRNMEEKDIDTIYKHMHQGFVSKYFENEVAQREFHNKKYEMIISSEKYIFHIFEDYSDNFIAMVSHKLEKDISEIAIYLNKDFREKNFSKEILKKSIEQLKETRTEIKVIEAFILEENIVSQKLFSSLNFKYVEVRNYNDLEYQIFKLFLD